MLQLCPLGQPGEERIQCVFLSAEYEFSWGDEKKSLNGWNSKTKGRRVKNMLRECPKVLYVSSKVWNKCGSRWQGIRLIGGCN